MLIDTHCHIHENDYPIEISPVLAHAAKSGVEAVFCVGTDESSSRLAVSAAQQHDLVWAVVGVHPHESTHGYADIERILDEKHPKVVGIGEIGLDYYYNHSPRDTQCRVFEAQLQLASEYGLPVSFHVREAFDDFWPILENFPRVKGVLHSFTDSTQNLEKGLQRGLYVGVNGISTFTRDNLQKELFNSIPIERLLLETDAPYLTPEPYRGKVNEPAFVKSVAEVQARQRNISFDELAATTTSNARELFALL